MTALGSTPEAQFVPGSNVKGAVEGANWCFLLPSLELGRAVFLGAPSPSALATLARLSEEVAVCAPARALRRLRGPIGGHEPSKVAWVVAERDRAVPLPNESADIVLIVGHPLTRRLAHRRRMEEEVERLLKPGGVLYVESRFAVDRGKPAGAKERPPARLERSTPLWLAPAWGEMRFAAPLADRPAIAYLERRFLNRRLLRPQLLRRPRRVIARQPTIGRLLGRRAFLLSRSGNLDLSGPPEYVRSLAAGAGIDVTDRRWALAAPGEYPSQKVLLFLFGPQDARPEAVVKITREATLNARLENEWRALVDLRGRGIGGDGSVPQPLFFGFHAGRGVLGETAIDGARFAERTGATADCPYALAVVDWLVELGAATAVPAEPRSAPALSELDAIFEGFMRTYRPSREHERFLDAQIAALKDGGDGLRLVFQHGDPGPWNVLLSDDGRPALLDWEAARPRGMPLWDIFHFLRSYGLAVSRAAGTRDRLRSFAEHYLDGSPLSEVIVETTRRVCARTGLAPSLVEPLFFTCWMHRALKEAATLPPDRLARGRYVNVLQLALDRRESPGLRRLFSAADAVGPPAERPGPFRTVGASDAC